MKQTITTHNPTLFVPLKVEPLEQWNPGPSFKTYQPQRAKFAAWNSGTNTAVYNFSRFQLTIRQNRGIRCIGQLEIVESAAYSGIRGSDSGIRTSTSGIQGSESGFRRLMHASIKMFVLWSGIHWQLYVAPVSSCMTAESADNAV